MLKSKENSLKMWELALLISLSVALCAGAWAQGRHTAISSKLLRLHVLAVSDSAEEQAVKLEVRDAVLEYISPKLKDAEGPEQARELVKAELEGIKSAAESAAQGRSVSVLLGRESYPTRSYEGFSLPAGEYDSLRVVLGEGRGRNWWCIVFPPVCLSAAQDDVVEEQLGEEDFRLISEDEGYQLRFKTLELWGQLTEKLQ